MICTHYQIYAYTYNIFKSINEILKYYVTSNIRAKLKNPCQLVRKHWVFNYPDGLLQSEGALSNNKDIINSISDDTLYNPLHQQKGIIM